MKVEIRPEVWQDLDECCDFYERQCSGLGDVFEQEIFSELRLLGKNAGIHPLVDGWHRALSRRFNAAIYYRIVDGCARVAAIADTRQRPSRLKRTLRKRK